jgi:NAD(P)-dependent dehydrogenase (short-subunit alcohol dehydrogenase family)
MLGAASVPADCGLRVRTTSKFGNRISKIEFPVSFSSFPTNSYALILGASSGFGAAAALEYARHGVHILGVHLDRASTMPQCEELQAGIRALGVEAHFFNVNAADAAQRASVLEQVQALFAARESASIISLVHSLAFGALKPFVAPSEKDALTQAQIEMTLNVMANSLVYWTQDVVRHGLMRSGGRIFAMTSSGSHRVLPMYGAVSAAKAALESYCRQLAFELGQQGIAVNAIQAGVTDTPALRKIPGSDFLIESARKRNPTGRLTTPEDVGRAVVLLTLPDAAWINGSTIRMDGGEDAVDVNWLTREG